MSRKPDIERQAPVINNVLGALDGSTCAIERLRILFDDAIGEMHELVVHLPGDGGEVDRGTVNRLYNNWIIFEVFRGLFAEFERDLIAINNKAHAQRVEVAI